MTLLMMAMILVTAIVSYFYDIPIIRLPITYDAEINAIAAARSNIPNIRGMLVSKRQELDMLLDIQEKIRADEAVEGVSFGHSASENGRNPGIVVSFFKRSQMGYGPVEFQLDEVEDFDVAEKTAVRTILSISVRVAIDDDYLAIYLPPAGPVHIRVRIDKDIFNDGITGADFYRESAYDDWYIELQYYGPTNFP